MAYQKKVLFLSIHFFFLFMLLIPELASGIDNQSFTEDKLKIEVEVNTEKDLLFLKELGLNCSALGKCICSADVSQLRSLKKANYVFRPYSKVLSAEKNNRTKQTRVFQVKIDISSETELSWIKNLGMDCTEIGECVTEVDIEQMSQLKRFSIPFSGIKEGIKVEGTSSLLKPAGSTYGRNDSGYYVPWATWTCSPITITNAPYDAEVTELEVTYQIYDNDCQTNTISVKLTDESASKEYYLWYYEGYGCWISETERDTTIFDGESVNQTWKLWVYDYSSPGSSIILPWSITLWFSGPPVYRVNRSDYTIPENWDSVCSPIVVNAAPADARVSSMDIHYDIIHPYISDLLVWVTDYDHSAQKVLWAFYGGSDDDIHETVTGITEFNGELVNQTWKLWASDWCQEDQGYIDFWSITLWYQELPDLVIKSITPSNPNPMKGEYISVDMMIENQGSKETGSFYVGLYYNLSYPPDIYTWEDKWQYVSGLAAGDSQVVTFTGITSADTATWNMYGLADMYGYIDESDEDNNYIGPKRVKWWGVNPKPDLVIEEAWVSGFCPYLTDSVFVQAVIKNQGGSPTTCNWFYTDIFYNRTTAPDTTMDGDDSRATVGQLAPGETDVVTFVLPSPAWPETWAMWLLTDSDDLVDEGNESNNVYGPIEIAWMESPAYKMSYINRDKIIEIARGIDTIEWICPQINATPRECSIESDWTSDYLIGFTYYGVPYEWGGFDDSAEFRCNLDKGLRAGSQKENDCIPYDPVLQFEPGDPAWATGIDCSGLVTRALSIPNKHSATMLIDHCDSIPGGYEYLLRGDILIKRGKHTYIFDSWVKSDSMCVIEAGDFRDEDFPDHSSEARKWNREKEFYESYFAFKNKDVPWTADHDMSGDANSDAKVDAADVTHLIYYLFHGSDIRPHPMWRGDTNGTCNVSVSDVVYLINYLYKGGASPYYCQSCPGWTCYPYP